jgi:hypothetical protein
VKEDGTFQGMVYLGTDREGADEWYKIVIVAHPKKRRFHEGEELMDFPDDVRLGNPVTVVRTR